MPHPSLTAGSFEVTPLCDGWAPLPLSDELPGVAIDWDAERDRFPWAFPPDDGVSWAWHVHSFLVRRADLVLLVDTGIGGFGRPPYEVTGRIEEELRAAGARPEDVSHVVLTHLHADHSGACLDDGSPRFPNARHHVHPDDWTFFGTERGPDDFTGRFAMEAIERAGLLDLDEADRDIAPGVRLEHAPGHTPGHRVLRIDEAAGTLLLTGDLLHVPPQVRHPDRPSNHDEDPELGAKQRARYIGLAHAGGWSVGVSHFGESFGRVGPEGWSSV